MVTAGGWYRPAALADPGPSRPSGRSGIRHRSALLDRFPPRSARVPWPAAQHTREQVLARLLAPPFAVDVASTETSRRNGLVKMLDWLEAQPGECWQDRWIASGADAIGNVASRWLVLQWCAASGRPGEQSRSCFTAISRGLLTLICGDVIRPGLGWLLTPGVPRKLAAEMARSRDPGGLARVTAITGAGAAIATATALRQISVIMAAKGGGVAEISAGDCLELLDAAGVTGAAGRNNDRPYFYQLLHAMGVFGPGDPPTTRAFNAKGQISVEQVIDGYGITCRPVRDLLIGYLRERQAAVDYTTLRSLASALGRLFWRDLELHHPGIDSLHLPRDVAAAWKQRIMTRKVRTTTLAGEVTEVDVPRRDAMNHLAAVRAFYLDLAEWAMDDPAQWGPWVAPPPVRDGEISHKKALAHRKSRMDARTRERMPVLPALIAAVCARHADAVQRLHTAQATRPGEIFTTGSLALRRSPAGRNPHTRTWAEDPRTGKRRDLTYEEHCAFWARATVEVLRLTGIRCEELTELSHHSLVQYRLPATGELIPLLHIAPSKTDIERLLVISPELADVLSTIIRRIRGTAGAVPLVISYDPHERVWNAPMPLLFQHRRAAENRPLTANRIRALLDSALLQAGLTDTAGQPLRYTPHDFRRIFVTDAVMNGMPPHIAQLICGHANISTTMAYKATYPEEVINGHRAFIVRRRATRPSEEYRVPTDAEWDEFLGHFERRKVAYGTCGRSYNTPCIHENSCLRCPLLRPDPAQRDRVAATRDNLLARIAEAERHGWLGEVEGLKISLAGARQKLAQMTQITARRTSAVDLGIPGFPGRAITTPITGKDPS